VSFACRRFRAAFSPGEPGAGSGHRQQCTSCDAYATALERAAAVRLPVPEGLRARLLAIPALPGAAAPAGEGRERAAGMPGAAAGSDPAPFAPVPQLPLPDGLRARLLALPQEAGRPRPPAWVLAPRYAIAASYLAAVLVGAALGDPGELGRRLARGIEQVVDRAESTGEQNLGSLQHSAAARLRAAREAAGTVGESVGKSFDRSIDRLDGSLPRLRPPAEGDDQPQDDAPDSSPGGARRR
jgi:hypothetical protein